MIIRHAKRIYACHQSQFTSGYTKVILRHTWWQITLLHAADSREQKSVKNLIPHRG